MSASRLSVDILRHAVYTLNKAQLFLGVTKETMQNFTPKLPSHSTLREAIADSLREAILQGVLKSGEKISEPELAAKFGISRTPIREAFRQLDSEGFLKVIPRKGARVAPLTEKDVREFYEVKSVLEGYSARLACPRLTTKEIERMEHLNHQMVRADGDKDYKQVFRWHNEFHNVFLRACGNDHLVQLIQVLLSKFQRFRLLLALAGKSMRSVEQHQNIVEAFRKKDALLAEKLVIENAMTGKDLIIGEIMKEMQNVV